MGLGRVRYTAGVHLGEGGCCHLHSPFVGGVHLQVVAVCTVEPQEPGAREGSVLPLSPRVHAAEGAA